MQHQLFRALVTAADGAFIKDQDQRIVFWNQAAERTLNFTFHEVIRQLCHEILKGRDDRDRLVCRKHCRVAVTALTGGAVTNYDTVVCTQSSGARWVNMSTLAFLPNCSLLCEAQTLSSLVETTCTMDTNSVHTVLTGAWNANATGSYDLYLQRTNNPANPTPIAYDELRTGSISPAVDLDAYTFTESAGTQG